MYFRNILNPFPHTTHLQQTTSKTSRQKQGTCNSINKGKSTEKSLKIVAKGEIACFEQFLLFSQCFQKSSAADASKCVYRWERVEMSTYYFKFSVKEIMFLLVFHSTVLL